MKAHAIYEEASAKGMLEAENERLRNLIMTSVLPILDKPHTFMDFHFKTVAAELRKALKK